MDLHSSNNRSHRSFFPLYQSSPHDHIHSHSQQSATTSTLSQDHPPPSVTIGPIPGHPFPKDFPKEKRSALPEVGQTRCYWALLTTSLQFTVLDPVLKYHLREQAPSILNCGLLDFVHPDERESAERDLGNVLAEKALHGSVTRVRYCRLSRVRRLLGWSDNSLPYPPTFPAERIAVDADYMAVYLVVNCVADGVVLCFIHAVVDIAPQADNDERRRSGWSNWCSTYGFNQDIPQFAHALYRRLCDIAFAVPRDRTDSSLRVLQILQNQTDRQLIVSWPPDSTLAEEGYVVSVGTYLAQLAQQVQLGYSAGNGDGDDPRTSCTRRYKSVQTLKLPTVAGSKILQVESILIPHGTIIFACHKISNVSLDLTRTYASTTNYYDIRSPDTGFQADQGLRNHDIGDTTPAPHTYVQQWVDQQLQSHVDRDVQSWEGSRDIPTFHSSPTNDRMECDPVGPGSLAEQNDWRDSRHPGKCPLSLATEIPSSSLNVAPGRENLEIVPPSATSSTTLTLHACDGKSSSPSQDTETPTSTNRARLARDRVVSHGRGQGTPPTGVTSCAHCQITHSPEWRKGPSGKKDLCNACGLRFSRSRAKAEGITSRKRKNKDKDSHPLSKMHGQHPDTATPVVEESSLQKHHENETETRTHFPHSHLPSDVNDWPGSLEAGRTLALDFSRTSHDVRTPYFSS